MPGSIYESAIGSPSGFSNGIDYHTGNSVTNMTAFLPVPQDCTTSNINFTVLNVQGTGQAAVYIANSTMVDLTSNPDVIYIGPYCVVTANNGAPVTCSAGYNTTFSQGTPIAIGISAPDIFNQGPHEIDAYANSIIMTSFVCQ